MNRWRAASLAALAIVVVCGWYVASPWVALYRMHAAVERGDAEAVIGYIDFDTLRADLKIQVRRTLESRPKPTSTLPPGWSLPERASSGGEEIERLIDAYVTPETVRRVISDAGPARFRARSGLRGYSEMARDIAIDREAVGRFVVRSKTDVPSWGLVFTARGLGWQVAGIRFPTNTAEFNARSLADAVARGR